MITVAAVGDLVLDEPDPASFLAPSAPLLGATDVAAGHVEVPHSPPNEPPDERTP